MTETDLYTCIRVRLQDCKLGQTVAQLSENLVVPEARIRAALHNLQTVGEVERSGDVWKYKGQEPAK
jgi:hypothetical protein